MSEPRPPTSPAAPEQAEAKLRGRALLERQLASFPANALTTRVCDALFRALPGAPPLPAYASIAEAARDVLPYVPEGVVARAEILADDPRIAQALTAARAIDTGDTGITIVTGVRSALSLVLGARGPGSGAEAQQSTDAALKALGLAYLVTQLVPRPPSERVEIFKTIPAGQELLLYFGAVEIALPLRREVEQANGTFVRDLVERQSRSVASKLLGILGRQGVEDAQETLAHLTRTLDEVVSYVVPHTGALAQSLTAVLPSRFTLGQAVQDVVAAGADALPAYRYLCARLAAESCLALAKLELLPEVEHPEIGPTDAPAIAPPPPPVLPEGLLSAAAAASGLRPGPAVDEVPEPAALPEGANPFEVPPVGEAPAPRPPPPAATPAARVGPANPFADDPPPAPAPDDAPPPPPVAVLELPTEPLPPDRRVTGAYLAHHDGKEQWLVFTREGLITLHPPGSGPPVDWRAHAGAGHPVGIYERVGDRIAVRWATGERSEHTLEIETYAVVVDGVRATRTDFNLVGQTLSGTWRDRGSVETVTFEADGRFAGWGSEGTYRLEMGSVALIHRDGRTEVRSFLSDLRPRPSAPDLVFLDGVPHERVL